jgi:uncharacterized protein (TIGR03086 family)
MTDLVDLAPAAGRMAELAAAVPDDRLDGPTPCPGMPVRALLSHVLGLSLAFRLAAEKAPSPGPPPDEPPPLPDDWRPALDKALDELVAAWRAPEAGTGMTAAGGLDMPAATAAVVALDELVLHGWDLARATGQRYEPDPADVRLCQGFVEAAARPEGVPGLFGPPVPVPPDAPPFDRLLGLSGRDPGWQPPGRDRA